MVVVFVQAPWLFSATTRQAALERTRLLLRASAREATQRERDQSGGTQGNSHGFWNWIDGAEQSMVFYLVRTRETRREIQRALAGTERAIAEIESP